MNKQPCIQLPECSECGGTTHILKPHKETCSQYEHLVDDHYDSPCMRGTCKHCNPGFFKKHASVSLTRDEVSLLEYLIHKEQTAICSDIEASILSSSLKKLKNLFAK